MTTQARSQCSVCVHFVSPFARDDFDGGPTCAAFPGGIPDTIYVGEFDHRNPWPAGDNGVRWTAVAGEDFPTYGLLPEDGPVPRTERPMTAAATDGDQVQTGAMIALLPSSAEAARLALDGGEPVEELHCTMVYLGEAENFDENARIDLVDAMGTLAEQWVTVQAEAFAPALFNPNGEDPCVVLVLSGEEVAEFHQTVLADAVDIAAIETQHQPYIPHVTLAYLEMPDADAGQWLAAATERSGPVTFDRIRVAFAGEVTDIPLAGAVPDDAAEIVAAAAAGVVTAAAVREAWGGCPRGFHAAHDGACPPAL